MVLALNRFVIRSTRMLSPLALGLGLALAQPGAAASPKIVYEDEIKREDNTVWSPPYEIREKLEEQELQRQKPGRETSQMNSTPWTGPDGAQLVGIVENRVLTKPQLQMRVNMFLQHQERFKDKVEEMDRRALTESRMLDDWIQFTMLAVHAEKNGYKVTAEEVQKTIDELAKASEGDTGKATEVMRMIGIPDSELRQEVRDSLLVEKLVKENVSKVFTEEQLRKIYEKNPKIFLKPTAIRTWHLFAVLGDNPDKKEARAAASELEKWAKRLRKAQTTEDLLAIQKEMGKREDIVLSDLGWVTANDMLEPPVLRELFRLKPGEISKVVAARVGQDQHYVLNVVKAVEREEGQKRSFEAARPQVESYMFDKVKTSIYAELKIKGNYEVHSDASGLKKYEKVESAEAPARKPKAKASARALPKAKAAGAAPAAVTAPAAVAGPAPAAGAAPGPAAPGPAAPVATLPGGGFSLGVLSPSGQAAPAATPAPAAPAQAAPAPAK